MAKYDALEIFLSGCSQQEMTLSFSRIESILGAPLPPSAHNHSAWWANGGHSQAAAWLRSGYAVETADLSRKTVTFRRQGQARTRSQTPKPGPSRPRSCSPAPVPADGGYAMMTVCGYPFRFLQALIPEQENGRIREYYPQADYRNKDSLPLHHHGHGPFCRFTLDAPPVSGVYLWVNEGRILYIGETADLRQRFNVGYGNISPRNCYQGGQSTNCKMNKVVLEYAKRGSPIRLYFYPTADYKQVELALLRQISTKYNVKDN